MGAERYVTARPAAVSAAQQSGLLWRLRAPGHGDLLRYRQRGRLRGRTDRPARRSQRLRTSRPARLCPRPHRPHHPRLSRSSHRQPHRAQTARSLWPNSPLAIGGGQATVTPELFDRQYVDLIVRGPGERIWRDLCRTGVPRGECRTIEDPAAARRSTAIRLPDRQITAKYRKHYKDQHSAPYRTPLGTRRPHRLHAAHPGLSVPLQFLRHLAGQSRPLPQTSHPGGRRRPQEHGGGVHLSGRRQHLCRRQLCRQLADAIRDAGIKKEISSYCRADHICKHPELMQKWYDIGLRYLVIGVEAVSTEKLKLFNKKTDQEQNIKSLQILRDIGIFAIPHILISPDMTVTGFRRCLPLYRRKRIRISGDHSAHAASRNRRLQDLQGPRARSSPTSWTSTRSCTPSCNRRT